MITVERNASAPRAPQSESQPRVIILLGPPGSGKSTQGDRLSTALHIPKLSTGDLLRAEMAAGTRLGSAVRGIVESGGIVEDAIVNALLAARLRQSDCEYGFILDGYPRTIQQANFLDTVCARFRFADPVILDFVLGIDVLLERLTSRQYCPACGRTYNLRSERPRTPGRCDNDDARLEQRADDRRAAVEERFRNHQRLSRMLERHFKGSRLHRIPADASPSEIFEKVMSVVAAGNSGVLTAVSPAS
jgi:adenylate kinase